ncbi:MAG: PfkB family carbohydrate kinase [Candidatus Methanoperedens sp.]|nr:PfkB family carbohydrate kinase [Candidatus Methanoperedens sp.]CAG0979072.1 Bifunctional protein HldE [Methanosarcinales archaeon]
MIEEIFLLGLGTILNVARDGIIGNTAYALSDKAKIYLKECLKDKKIINDDLQKSVCKSFLVGLKNICDDCLNDIERNRVDRDGFHDPEAIRWLNQKKENLNKNLQNLKTKEYFLQENEVKFLIGDSSSDEFEEVKRKLVKAAIGNDNPPECYKKEIDKTFFLRMCFFFANDIKHDQVISNIIDAKLLTEIADSLQRMTEKAVPDLSIKMDSFYKKMGEVDSTLKEVKIIASEINGNVKTLLNKKENEGIPKTTYRGMRTLFQELCEEYESHKKVKNILIVGDVMLDHKMEGREAEYEEVQFHDLKRVYKLSDKSYESKTLGGAANVAWAFSKVSRVTLIGVIGSDCEGETLVNLCKEPEINFLPIRIPQVMTTTKIYFYSESPRQGEEKSSTRFDREDSDLMESACNDCHDYIITKINEAGDSHNSPIDCIVLKDHEKGMISEKLFKEVSKIAHERKIPLFVDPKYKWRIFNNKGVKIEAILPNIKEASSGIYPKGNIQIRINARESTLLPQNYKTLVDTYPNCGNFIIKADKNGAVILSMNANGMDKEEIKPLPLNKDEFVTGVGCGDVFDAFAIIGILHKHSLEESVLFANFVAGLRTKKPLGVVMSPGEIKQELETESFTKYIIDNERVVNKILELKK